MSIISFLMFRCSHCTDWAGVVTRIVVFSDDFFSFFLHAVFINVRIFAIFSLTQYIYCYVAISVPNQSLPGQRINSLHVIETDAAYRNPRFRSIPSGKLPRMGLEKENLFASETINSLQEKNNKIPRS